jgi:hypothetical protein
MESRSLPWKHLADYIEQKVLLRETQHPLQTFKAFPSRSSSSKIHDWIMEREHLDKDKTAASRVHIFAIKILIAAKSEADSIVEGASRLGVGPRNPSGSARHAKRKARPQPCARRIINLRSTAVLFIFYLHLLSGWGQRGNKSTLLTSSCCFIYLLKIHVSSRRDANNVHNWASALIGWRQLSICMRHRRTENNSLAETPATSLSEKGIDHTAQSAPLNEPSLCRSLRDKKSSFMQAVSRGHV